jgi:hypothetical protein
VTNTELPSEKVDITYEKRENSENYIDETPIFLSQTVISI